MHIAHSLFFPSHYNDLLNIAKDFYITRSSNFLFVNKYLLASIIWEGEIILFEVFCSLLVNIIFSFFEALFLFFFFLSFVFFLGCFFPKFFSLKLFFSSEFFPTK